MDTGVHVRVGRAVPEDRRGQARPRASSSPSAFAAASRAWTWAGQSCASRRPIPVVFIAGSADASTKAQALLMGCVAYLEEPVSSEQLISAIRSSGASSPWRPPPARGDEPSARPHAPAHGAGWSRTDCDFWIAESMRRSLSLTRARSALRSAALPSCHQYQAPPPD